MFADIDLSSPESQALRGPPHNPGQGGWPTIRYFNKETGLDGGSYIKKTDKAICDELGTIDAMTELVEDYGDIATCDILSGLGCDERELGYIDKMKQNSLEEHMKQLKRLEGMANKPMKPELLVWMKKRKSILKQFVKSSEAEL